MVVKLIWTDTEANEVGYLVRRSDDGGVTWTTLAILPPNSTAYDDTSTLIDGQTYTYSVTTLCAECQSGDTTITFRWNASSDDIISDLGELELQPFDSEVVAAVEGILREWLLGEDFGDTFFDTGNMPFGTAIESARAADDPESISSGIITGSAPADIGYWSERGFNDFYRDPINYVENSAGTVRTSLKLNLDPDDRPSKLGNINDGAPVYEFNGPLPMPMTLECWSWIEVNEDFGKNGPESSQAYIIENILFFDLFLNCYGVGELDDPPLSGNTEPRQMFLGTPGTGDRNQWQHTVVTLSQVGEADEAQIYNAGTGYTVSDTLIVSGGTGTPMEIQVSSVDGNGAITGINVTVNGNYSDYPNQPASVTGGTGSGALFMLGTDTYDIGIYFNGVLQRQKTNFELRNKKFWDVFAIGDFNTKVGPVRAVQGILSDIEITDLYNSYTVKGPLDKQSTERWLSNEFHSPAIDSDIQPIGYDRYETPGLVDLTTSYYYNPYSSPWTGDVGYDDITPNSTGSRIFAVENTIIREDRTALAPYTYFRDYAPYSFNKLSIVEPVVFSPDGLNVLFLDTIGFTQPFKTVFGLTLSEAYNLREIRYSHKGMEDQGWGCNEIDFSSIPSSINDFNVTGLFAKPDGTEYYLMINDDNTFFACQQYTMSVPWDVETATLTNTFDFYADNTYFSHGIYIGDSGSKAFVTSQNSGEIRQYTLSSPWDISTASYDTVNETLVDANGITFSPDGLNMYIASGTNPTNTLNDYSLSGAWDLSTATAGGSQSFGAQDDPLLNYGIMFEDDGLTMYAPAFGRWSLSVAWDISTATYNTHEFDFGNELSPGKAVFMKPDGTSIYILSLFGNNIHQYDFSVAEDLDTLSYSGNFYTAAEPGTACSFAISSDGTKLFILMRQSDRTLYQYTLSPAWDISSATYDTVSFTFPLNVHLSSNLNFRDDGLRFFVLLDGGFSNDSGLYQYDLGSAWDLSTINVTPSIHTSFRHGTLTSDPSYIKIVNSGGNYIVGSEFGPTD